MRRYSAQEVTDEIGMIGPPEEFWGRVLEEGAGTINHPEKIAETGDRLMVDGVEFRFSSVADEKGTGVFVHRFEKVESNENQ